MKIPVVGADGKKLLLGAVTVVAGFALYNWIRRLAPSSVRRALGE